MISRRVWRATLILIGVLATSIAAAMAVGRRSTEPPRAGPQLWENTPPSIWQVSSEGQVRDMPIYLPAPPYTLIITARFSTTSDPFSYWGVSFRSGIAQPITAIDVTSDGRFYLLMTQANVWIPHLRPAGEFNQLILDVSADRVVTLWFNDQVAWREQFDASMILPGDTWSLYANPGQKGEPATLTWEQIAVYAPSQK